MADWAAAEERGESWPESAAGEAEETAPSSSSLSLRRGMPMPTATVEL
jgi:hypothetical protein